MTSSAWCRPPWTPYGRVDVLVNNAGIVGGVPFGEESIDTLARMVDVHVWGSILCARAVVPIMRRQGYGRIVNDLSAAPLYGIGSRAAYGTSKGAAIGMTRGLGFELEQDGILVNAVAPRARVGRAMPPGSVSASVLGAQVEERFTPERVAPLVAYLCSEACTGTRGLFSAAGGWYGALTLGLGPGWVAPGTEPPAAQDVADHFAEIDRDQPQDRVRSVDEETEAVLARLSGEASLPV